MIWQPPHWTAVSPSKIIRTTSAIAARNRAVKAMEATLGRPARMMRASGELVEAQVSKPVPVPATSLHGAALSVSVTSF